MEQVDDGLWRAVRAAPWRWIAAVWGAIFAFDTLRHGVDALLDGREGSLRWVLVSGASLALWAALTPLMMWMGRRTPIDRTLGRVALHTAVVAAIVLVDAGLQRALWGGERMTFPSVIVAVLVVDVFSYIAVAAIGHVQHANARYRERVHAEAALSQELTAARLRALEMQLQPHFLFNTLHAVGALVRSARPDDAVRSLATLGGLLRATLADGDQHEIALADELALADRYLELQQIRFAERLQVDIEVAPDVEQALVPRLILQPLLENAVRHGVEHSATQVAIEVRAQACGGRLELIVRDHGGTREGATPGHGIGLANTRARLAALYGAAHRLELTPTTGGGRAVRIEIPLALQPVRPAGRTLEVMA